ncbi:MAG: arginine--tRNA ligase [Thermomicrobiales bacterium]
MSADTSTKPASNVPAAPGIIASEEAAAVEAIREGLLDSGIDPGSRPIDLRTMPFDGAWGSASTACRIFAGEAVTAELTARGDLENLSKKEAKAKVNELVGAKSQDIAASVASAMSRSGRFARVEAVNGYINVYYDATRMATRLISEVLETDLPYGWAAPGTHATRVMIEHSQLNTHKAAHVGHLRNICIGVVSTNISKAAGYETMPVTYIGDIGRHVIQCLWCYTSFHAGQEPKGDAPKGAWLGEIYAESSARLRFRKDVISFLAKVSQEDQAFVLAVDKMLKFLWRKNTNGEDIAYLLGRISHMQEIDPAEFREDDVMIKFWPIIGQQLRDQVEYLANAGEQPEPVNDRQTAGKPVVEQTMTPEERVEEWERLSTFMDTWWPNSDRWEEEVKETFQRWERKDPELVALWEKTRQWSLDDLQRIFTEFDATFDHWFFESEVEDRGREIVEDLLDRGIAEISDGLPVVKIDEQLGLETETYRTMPILRSDGTTLYSTKDLALTQQKFIDFGVDQAIWIVDVRQSLYFDQISKILEIAGFAQAKNAMHLGYEFVALPTGVMSSRKGTAPMLEDVRDTMTAEALRVIEERMAKPVTDDRRKQIVLTPDEQHTIAHQVAIGAIKYAMVARDFNKVIIFDPEEALSFDGHAAPYIQYAHARACRILENGGVDDDQVRASLATLDFSSAVNEELSLLQTISEFPGIVQRAAEEHRPLHMTNYVYDLARRFNDFYHACPVLIAEEPQRSARLSLVAATRMTLSNGLTLLGIAAPTQM